MLAGNEQGPIFHEQGNIYLPTATAAALEAAAAKPDLCVNMKL